MNQNTARGAITSQDEIVKLRMQSTSQNLIECRELLEQCEKSGVCEILNISSIYKNKGTKKYCRMYSDIKISREVNKNV